MLTWKRGLAVGACALGLMIGTQADAAVYKTTITADGSDMNYSDDVSFDDYFSFEVYFTVTNDALVKDAGSSSHDSQNTVTKYSGITVDRIYGESNSSKDLLMSDLAGTIKLSYENKMNNDAAKKITIVAGDADDIELVFDVRWWSKAYADFFGGTDSELELKSPMAPGFKAEHESKKLYEEATGYFYNDMGFFYGLMMDFEEVASLPNVPEPASLAMLGLGGLALLGRKRGN